MVCPLICLIKVSTSYTYGAFYKITSGSFTNDRALIAAVQHEQSCTKRCLLGPNFGQIVCF